MYKISLFGLILSFVLIPQMGLAQGYNEYEQKLVDEHVFEGFPGFDNIRIRRAYVLSYNNDDRIANWVAYHVVPDYLKTVPRYGRFSVRRSDWSIHHAVFENEYDSLRAKGLTEGYLAPFAISGGDRDNDDLYAVRDANGDGRITKEDMAGYDMSVYVNDADEMGRVYEINYLSNIVPMYKGGFKGSRGLWDELERYLEDTIVRTKKKKSG